MVSANGLPPAARLRRAADFSAMRHARGRIETRYFLIRYQASATGSCRMGLAVSRRVSKRAVTRNRIKRAARESFRRARAGLPEVDVLLIARNAAADADNDSLRADLQGAWPRLKTLKPVSAPGTMAD